MTKLEIFEQGQSENIIRFTKKIEEFIKDIKVIDTQVLCSGNEFTVWIFYE
jgi:exosome complex RNA-binding protein Rrp42 (RNase PH superfamily)